LGEYLPRTTTDDDDDDNDDDDNNDDVSESILIVRGHGNELIVVVISLSSLTTVFLALIVIFGRFMNFIIGLGLGEFLTTTTAAAVSIDLLQGLLPSAVSVEGMSESSLMPSSLLLAKLSSPSTLIDLMPIIVLSSAVSRDPEMLSKPHGMTSS